MSEESIRVAEARRRAEQARAQFWASFDALVDYAQALQDKLAPSSLARDAWDAAKSKGADIAEDAVDAVRKRPVAAGGAVAALALFIAREPLMDLAARLMSSKDKKKTKPAKGRKTRGGKEPVEKVDE